MKRVFTLFAICLAFWSLAQDQTVTVAGVVRTYSGVIHTTIQEVKSIAGADAACRDLSYFHNATVQFRGRAMMSGKITFPQATIDGVVYPAITTTPGMFNNNGSRHVNALRAGNGPFSTILIRPVLTAVGERMINEWLEDDSIQVMGRVENFSGMAQFNMYDYTILGSSTPFEAGRNPKLITTLGVLNDPNFNNFLETGEQYEGAFVEIKDILISSINSFSANRYNIVLRDKDGNRVALGDRFMAGTSPLDTRVQGGRLTLPVVGARYSSIKGIIYHAKRVPTGCVDDGGGQVTFNEAGYQLHPFHPDHFTLDPNVPPIIENIKVTPSVPTTSNAPVVSADISSIQSTIAYAKLYYAVGDTSGYKTLNMTAQGTTYSATIPSAELVDGKIVYYFIEAGDASSNQLISFKPAVSLPGVGRSVEQPLGFVVKNAGLSIYDVQYTPFKDGNSLYAGKTVTLTGIVTASTKDLGNVVIQDKDATAWGAIMLDNSLALSNIKRGDEIRVSGLIEERATTGAHRFTILKDVASTDGGAEVKAISTANVLTPLTVDPVSFSGFYDFAKHERYEHLYVEVANPSGGKLFVVDTNADHTSNFAEYRIGNSAANTSLLSLTSTARNISIPGLRVLAGRAPSSSAFNSQNVSLICAPKGTSGTVPANITVNGIDVVYVNTSIFMDKVRGILQHSFSNMKLLPRNNADFIGISVPLPVNPEPTVSGISSSLLPVSVHPNPASESITLQIAGSAEYQYSLHSITGTECAGGRASGVYVLSVAHLPKGLYVLTVKEAYTGRVNKVKIVLQ